LAGFTIDVTERKASEKALREGEEKYRVLTEGINDVIWTLDVETLRFTYVSPSVFKLRGFTPEEILAAPLDAEFPTNASGIVGELIKSRSAKSFESNSLEPNSYVEEVAQPCKDGSVVWTEVVTNYVLNPHTQRVEIRGVTRNISERRRVEKTLRENELRQRMLLENLHTAIIVHGSDTQILFSNPRASYLLGLTEEQMSGKLAIDPAWNFVDEKGKILALDDYPVNRVLATHRPFDNLVLGIQVQGREGITWVIVSAFPEFDSNRVIQNVVVNFHDISTLRNAEKLVRESEEIFHKTFNLAAVGIARVALDGSWLEVNESICEIVGYTKAELLNLTFQDITHPDDLNIDLEYVQQILAGSIPTYRLEKRYFHKDGHIVWVNLSVALVRKIEGTPSFFISIVEDINLRKQTESQLLKLSQAVEQSPNTIVITDLEANIEYVNATFTKVTGYTLEEARGKNPRILQSGRTPKATYVRMWEQLSRGEEWRGELINQSKDGNEYIEWALISPVRQTDGHITNYLAVKENITDKKFAEERIKQLAYFDQLTGLPNRSLLNERFKYAMSLAERSGEQLAVMFLDLDHFKDINDTLGHSIGDAVLIEVANRLKATIREEDTVSRLGGDEFILVFPGINADGAAIVASKLVEAVSMPYLIDEHELVGTPSIGIAIYPNDGDNFEDLLKNADTAMYRVKQESRNNFRFFTAEMQSHSERNLQLVNAMRHALERNEFHLLYQPQVTLSDGHIIGAEALLRWQHPELGLISPAEFIPIAEDSGQIIHIGEWVLRESVSQMKAWMDSGLPPMVVAVNLSAIQFRQPHLPELVTRILEEAQLPAEYLELELTEAVAMDDPQVAVNIMDELFARGIRMSIDDFGTGYSSLSYLKRFKVYKLKIDQSFVRDISDDPEDKAIVTAIINLASSLDMHTIAEGVETAAQLAFLRLQGCDEVQGYYFSKPLPAIQFEEFVRKQI
jgi:diguanylate cyclase (GGDEF)-like protein/PAS domain S-box-containing protein